MMFSRLPLPLLALLIGQLLWTLIQRLPQGDAVWVAPVLHFTTVAVAVVYTWQFWEQDRRQRALGIFTAALSVHLIADILVRGQFSFVLPGTGLTSNGLGQSLYMVTSALIVWALMMFLPRHLPAQRQVGQVLDGMIIAGTAGILLWAGGASRLFNGLWELDSLVRVGSVLLNLLILGLTLVVLRHTRRNRVNLLLAAGLLLYVVSHIWAVLLGHVALPGGGLDLLWSLGLIFQITALHHLVRPQWLRQGSAAGSGIRSLKLALSVMPYVAVPLACVSLLLSVNFGSAFLGDTGAQGVLWGTVSVILLATLRNGLTAIENADMTSELRERRAELEHLAYHDPLTGLANRAAFTQFFANDARVKGGQPYTIFSLDLNGFKEINDVYGHATGDLMLRHVAKLLYRAVAAPGQIFRWGGDEFVIVVPGMQRPADAEALARFIEANVTAPMMHQGQRLSVGTAVGYALGRGAENHEAMLSLADSDMYAGKQRGGRHR